MLTSTTKPLTARHGGLHRGLALLLGLLCTVCVAAKDIKTLVVTTTPQMHCANCEKKIKGNLRFEKGVTKIDTNVEQQRVTINYDADKTTPERIIKAFGKFGYTARPVAETPAEKPQPKK